MNIDLTQLSKLRREDIKPGHVVKFVENEGEESIPKPSKLWLSMKKYNFKGELLKNYTSIIYQESQHPRALADCLAHFKRGELSWVRLSSQQVKGDDAQKTDGLYFKISIQKYKVLFGNNSTLAERMDVYRCNKKVAAQYFERGEYNNAIQFYQTCKNTYQSLPKKRDITAEQGHELDTEVMFCNRNIVICILKGEMVDKYEGAKKIMEEMIQKDEKNAKNWFILGKLQLALKYKVLGKESLVKSYKLEQTPYVLEILKNLQKTETNTKFVFKNVIDKMSSFNEEEEKEQLRRERNWKLQEEEERKRKESDEWVVDEDGLIVDKDDT